MISAATLGVNYQNIGVGKLYEHLSGERNVDYDKFWIEENKKVRNYMEWEKLEFLLGL